jgi:uridylate kinase
MKKVVISLGGSVLVPAIEANRCREYAAVLSEIGSRLRLYVVVGGGGEARRCISAARELGADEGSADEIGIEVTRLNASLLIATLGDSAYPLVPLTHHEARAAGEGGRIVVMGGITPGQTTDAVAAVLAEEVRADLLVNLTAIDGVYSADPAKDKEAVRYRFLTPEKLLGIVREGSLAAGSNTVMDMVAAAVVVRSRIPLIVMDGRDPAALKKALDLGVWDGTLVAGSDLSPLPL